MKIKNRVKEKKVKTKECPQCGAQVKESNNECNECGYLFESEGDVIDDILNEMDDFEDILPETPENVINEEPEDVFGDFEVEEPEPVAVEPEENAFVPDETIDSFLEELEDVQPMEEPSPIAEEILEPEISTPDISPEPAQEDDFFSTGFAESSNPDNEPFLDIDEISESMGVGIDDPMDMGIPGFDTDESDNILYDNAPAPSQEKVLYDTPQNYEAPKAPVAPKGQIGDIAGYCPTCGAPYRADFVWCTNCGTRLKEATLEEVTPLMTASNDLQLRDRIDVDYSNAIEGDKTIVYKNEAGKYIAVMAPKQVPIYVLTNRSEEECEVLKADYALRVFDSMPLGDKIKYCKYLKKNASILKTLFKTKDLDEIYGDGMAKYGEVKAVSKDLLDTHLAFDALKVLSETDKKTQNAVAKTMKDNSIDSITVSSAKRIALGNKTKEQMDDIILQDASIKEMLRELVGSFMK